MSVIKKESTMVQQKIEDCDNNKSDDNIEASRNVSNRSKKTSTKSPEEQLQQEVRYRMTMQTLRQVWELLPSNEPDTVVWSVSVLEQSIKELEEELQMLKNGEGDLDSEYRLRYEAQADLNKKLKEQIELYEEDVSKMEERAKKGNDCKFDADLNDMSEFELARLLRHLERERNNLYGDLRNKSWQLDNQSQEYHKSKELAKAYTGDLTIVNRDLEQIWRKKSKVHETGLADNLTPVTSPAALLWSGEGGVRPFQRILDPKKGPIRKTAGVHSLPRLDQSATESTKSGNRRTKSMATKVNNSKSQENLSRQSRWSVHEVSKNKTPSDRCNDFSTSLNDKSDSLKI